MRVLIVVEPGKDGVFRHAEGLAIHLLESGYQIALAYSSVRGSDRLEKLVAKLAALNCPVLDLQVSNAPSLRDFAAIYRLWQFVCHVAPDVIHAHSSKAGALVRILGALRLRPSIFYTPNAYYGMGKAGFRALFFNEVERVLGQIGDTINVSRDEADFARSDLGISATRQQMIPNGIDTRTFRPVSAGEKSSIRKRLNIPEFARLLVTVGRFSAQKDYTTLYRALIPALQRHPELILLHVGSGTPEFELLDQIVELGLTSRIRRIEYLQDTVAVYQAADAFMLTSRYEGLSYAVLEALACNLPLILSSAPGNREFMYFDLSHCYFAPVGDVPAFTLAIESWLRDRDASRLCNHRQLAERAFEVSQTCARIVEAYRNSIMAIRRAN